MLDLVIKNANILDGTGAPAFVGDVAVKDGKIVTVGGIYGVVAEVKENHLLVEVDNGVKIKVDKTCVVNDITDVQGK